MFVLAIYELQNSIKVHMLFDFLFKKYCRLQRLLKRAHGCLDMLEKLKESSVKFLGKRVSFRTHVARDVFN